MDGVVCLLKPPGMTSSNAVSDIRKLYGQQRVGHLGTLDPAAAGVLPVCIGRATRLFDLLVDKEKEYVFEAAFGKRTDTQDAFGKVMERDDRRVGREEVQDSLPAFLGKQMQEASIYSALKVDGRKMCDLARAGEAVQPKIREIDIREIELLGQTSNNRFLIRTVCSRGTYIRSLCESIAKSLGTVAYVSFLLRTRSGPFTIEHARTLNELEEEKSSGALMESIVSCEEATSFLPELRLGKDREAATKNGLETNLSGVADGVVRAYASDQFLGIGEIQAGKFRLSIHLYESPQP